MIDGGHAGFDASTPMIAADPPREILTPGHPCGKQPLCRPTGKLSLVEILFEVRWAVRIAQYLLGVTLSPEGGLSALHSGPIRTRM